MSGPGNWSSNQTGYVLHAIYLRDLIPADQRPSLDYKPSPNDEVNSARGKNSRLAKRRKNRTQAKSSSRRWENWTTAPDKSGDLNGSTQHYAGTRLVKTNA